MENQTYVSLCSIRRGIFSESESACFLQASIHVISWEHDLFPFYRPCIIKTSLNTFQVTALREVFVDLALICWTSNVVSQGIQKVFFLSETWKLMVTSFVLISHLLQRRWRKRFHLSVCGLFCVAYTTSTDRKHICIVHICFLKNMFMLQLTTWRAEIQIWKESHSLYLEFLSNCYFELISICVFIGLKEHTIMYSI